MRCWRNTTASSTDLPPTKWGRSSSSAKWNTPASAPTREVTQKALDLFDKAKATAPPDSVYGRRIALVDEFLPTLRNRASQIDVKRPEGLPEYRVIDMAKDKWRDARDTLKMDGKLDEPFWTAYNYPRRLRDLRTGKKPKLPDAFSGALVERQPLLRHSLRTRGRRTTGHRLRARQRSCDLAGRTLGATHRDRQAFLLPDCRQSRRCHHRPGPGRGAIQSVRLVFPGGSGRPCRRRLLVGGTASAGHALGRGPAPSDGRKSSLPGQAGRPRFRKRNQPALVFQSIPETVRHRGR